MWCSRCKKDTHWTGMCHFSVAQQRYDEGTAGRGRGRGRGAPQQHRSGAQEGAARGGRGSRGPQAVGNAIECHLCSQRHVAGSCKFLDAVNKLCSKLVSTGQAPTADDMDAFRNELVAQNTQGKADQIALVARQVLDEVRRSSAMGCVAGSSTDSHGHDSAQHASDADRLMREELESLRAQVAPSTQDHAFLLQQVMALAPSPAFQHAGAAVNFMPPPSYGQSSTPPAYVASHYQGYGLPGPVQQGVPFLTPGSRPDLLPPTRPPSSFAGAGISARL